MFDRGAPLVECRAVALTPLTSREKCRDPTDHPCRPAPALSLIHLSEPTRLAVIPYAVFFL
ncbi:hypothetical protein, partial [Streptomyces sp. McG8]|uniref:hypothetical protein n=1 Tax=Streptomyces sp. McG8 TaxID=2725487 RepID=UPI001BE8C4FD